MQAKVGRAPPPARQCLPPLIYPPPLSPRPLTQTTIRVMGGLLSAHLLASDDAAAGVAVPGYRGELLNLAEDLGDRLLRAFDTPTGVPFGAVNLKHG